MIVLEVGIGAELLQNCGCELESSKTLEDAKIMLKSKLYDAVIINYTLPDGKGIDITLMYPHYRTIIVSKEEDLPEIKSHRNGFHSILTNLDTVHEDIMSIVKNNPKKDKDFFMTLLNIQGSIETINDSNRFMKINFNNIHIKLQNLENAQKAMIDKFDIFEDQKIKTEQFYIDTLLGIKESISGNTD